MSTNTRENFHIAFRSHRIIVANTVITAVTFKRARGARARLTTVKLGRLDLTEGVLKLRLDTG